MRIMMSAAGSAVAPSIIRHLQSLGHFVVGHDCSPYGSAANEFMLSPKASDRFSYLKFLRDCVDGEYDVYLPFLDEELRLNFFDDWSPPSTLHIFTSKINQFRALLDAGLPVPLKAISNAIARPDHGQGGKGVFLVPNDEVAHAMHGRDNYIVQQLIRGDEYTVDVLTGMDGAFLFAVPRLRIQANGVSVIGKIVMDAEIIDLARLVVSKFAFRGPINIQIIRERDTGKLYIIELNPRLSGSCIFTVMAGFDILDATIKLWEGKPFVRPDKIEDGLVIRRHYVEERL